MGNILQDLLNGVIGLASGGAAKGGAKTAVKTAPLQQMSAGIPVGQGLTPENIAALSPDIQPLAQIYNANPQDPRVAHLDPAMFGYAPDNTVAAPAPQAWRSPITGAGPIRPGNTPYSPGEGPFIPRR